MKLHIFKSVCCDADVEEVKPTKEGYMFQCLECGEVGPTYSVIEE